MLISDWSSDVCSSDLRKRLPARKPPKAKPDGPGPGARLRGHFLSMQLWVGLGNPGAQYALNRHNVGFMAVDAIAEDHGFDQWRSRFQDRKSTRLNSSTNSHLVCRLVLEKKKRR